MRGAVAAVAAAGLVCAACASSPAEPGSSSTRTTQTTRATSASGAGNKIRAEAEAARLLAEVQLPAGAVKIATAPSALHDMQEGLSSTSALIDKARFWRVPLSIDAALAWIRAHPPAGLTLGGSLSETGPGVETRGIVFADRDTAAWQQAQLQIGLAPLGVGVSAIRADGVALWIDPRPMKDAAMGRRMRVTVTDGCPSMDPGIVGVSNPGADLGEELVPAGSPIGGLLCRYVGPNGTPFALIAHRRLSADAARHIATLARRISLDHIDDQAPSTCPGDDGSATVIVLSYRGRADVDLWLHRRGCPSLSNGHIETQIADGLDDFAAAVAALGG
jgi:hypothetical protein